MPSGRSAHGVLRHADGAVSSACASQEKVRLHRALALDLQWAARLECKIVTQDPVYFTGDMDAARDAEGFHPACRIHGISPDVVDEFMRPNHAGDDRPGMNADPRLQIDAESGARALYDIQHV